MNGELECQQALVDRTERNLDVPQALVESVESALDPVQSPVDLVARVIGRCDVHKAWRLLEEGIARLLAFAIVLSVTLNSQAIA